jgi:hypothetical protein
MYTYPGGSSPLPVRAAAGQYARKRALDGGYRGADTYRPSYQEGVPITSDVINTPLPMIVKWQPTVLFDQLYSEMVTTRVPDFGVVWEKTMRMFNLVRHYDETGISGEGFVAQGVVFDDGTVAMRWTTDTNSTVLYDNIESVEKIHGHGGKTQIVWIRSS